MDLSEPGLAFAGSLTMPILRALDGRSQPASVAQVARVTDQGTIAGIRRALDRLSIHGICRRDELGGRALYSLNYDHVLYRAVRGTLDAHDALIRALRKRLAEWTPEAAAGVLFGSAARQDGDVDSDIDLLLVRPEMSPGTLKRGWARDVHELRGDVLRWTGNHLQVIDWSESALRRHQAQGEPLVNEILRDGVLVAGAPLTSLLGRDRPRASRVSTR